MNHYTWPGMGVGPTFSWPRFFEDCHQTPMNNTAVPIVNMLYTGLTTLYLTHEDSKAENRGLRLSSVSIEQFREESSDPIDKEQARKGLQPVSILVRLAKSVYRG